MNYHLNRQGQPAEVFPLEELRRRRAVGELTGAELVWCEGMAQWQPLDDVLRQKSPGASRPPRHPQPLPKTNPVVLVVVGLVLLVFVCGLVFLGIAIAKKGSHFGQAMALMNQARTPPLTAEAVQALAARPVVWPTNAMTAADIQLRNRKFCIRQFVDGYKVRGERCTNAATDALALGLVENWVADEYRGPANTNLPSLAKLSGKLAADPDCTDPIVLTVIASRGMGLRARVPRMERVVKAFEHSKHLGYPKFFATVTLANSLARSQTNRVPELDALALRRLREALADGSIEPGDQDNLCDILLADYAHNFFTRNQLMVISLVQTRGKAFQWLALVLEGNREMNLAWKARTGGTDQSSDTSDWQGYYQHLGRGRECFTQAWELDPKRPQAPCGMINVAFGSTGLAEMRLWFDRTLAAQPDDGEAWNDFRWGLRTDCYGNTNAMLAFGITALNTRRFETTVPEQFFNSLKDLEEETALPAGTHLYGREDIWPRLQEMYEGYVTQGAVDDAAGQSGNSQPSDVWRSQYIAVACLAGKYTVAAKELAAMNWRPAPDELDDWGLDPELTPWEIAARTSAQSNVVTAAESSRSRGDLTTALKLYHDLGVATNLDERARSFVAERSATLDLETRLQTHEWVDWLPSDTNFSGWRIERGNWTLDPDRSLAVQAGTNGHLFCSLARLGSDFEVRGQFEVQPETNQSFQAGLVMGDPRAGGINWYSFRMKRTPADGDAASFERNRSRRGLHASASLNDVTNTFYFRYQNGKVSATVNNRNVFTDAAPPRPINIATNELRLGLGVISGTNESVIRYRNVQARLPEKLTGFRLTTPTK